MKDRQAPLDEPALQAFRACVRDTADQRRQARRLVAGGRWLAAEPDQQRARLYALRRLALESGAKTDGGPESIIGAAEDFLRVSFLAQGAARARAVAYVEVNSGSTSAIATGFLVSPRLFLTNQHVIADIAAARGTQLSFLRELDEQGTPRATTSYLLDPDAFALFSPSAQLDYALVALGQRQSGLATPQELGFCALSDQPDKHVIGMNANIIQHPSGWLKMISIRNNTLTARTEDSLLYETDTQQGSSGAPVFNDDWQLVALHHWGEPYLAAAAGDDQAGSSSSKRESSSRNVNEGVRISAIYRDLVARLDSLPAAWQALLREALSYQDTAPADGVARLAPHHPATSAARPDSRAAQALRLAHPEETTMPAATDAHSLTLTIPLTVTVRIGDDVSASAVTATTATANATPVATAGDTLPQRRLSPARGAEAVRVDLDYGNRGGYDPAFIPGVKLPLPKPDAQLAPQIAPLAAGQPKAADGELKYEHFSLKLIQARRIAAFTATNIDGQTYLSVDRGTGRVAANQAEGDAWFKDPRVADSAYLGQDFYSAWSSYFDRGHLTRRSDPTWGTPAEAERANADTFHFTNCSPQHFRFNQSAVYWQGLERYVLENGVLADSAKGRICVFQGPVFNDQVDMWADDVQIPSAFFKIVVWQGQQGLKAVGLLADQSALLSESRRSLGAPQALPQAEVNHWRVGIARIEQITGLDFGTKVRGADTIASAEQPQVGEAGVRVTAFAQIRL